MKKPSKVLIVDDQVLVRNGLKSILELEEEIVVAGTAKSGLEAVSMVQLLQPDVLLVDIRMPEMDGVECIKIIKEKDPDVKIIMLTIQIGTKLWNCWRS